MRTRPLIHYWCGTIEGGFPLFTLPRGKLCTETAPYGVSIQLQEMVCALVYKRNIEFLSFYPIIIIAVARNKTMLIKKLIYRLSQKTRSIATSRVLRAISD